MIENSYFEKVFFNEFTSYKIFLENYMNTHHKISKQPTNEIKEYEFIGKYMLNFSKDDIFIDVGANFGLASLAVGSRGYTTYCFEPLKSNYNFLKKSVEYNNYDKFIYTYNFGLGNCNKEEIIYIPECTDNCSLNRDAAVLNMTNKSIRQENIQIIKFDDWLQNKNIDLKKIRFIKIDTQGYELQVLLGMEKFIKNNNNIHILLEWDTNLSALSGNNLFLVSQFFLINGFQEIIDLNGDKVFYKK